MKVPESIVTNEDCMQMMGRYPDKFFKLAIVDPPYGIDIMNKGGYPESKDFIKWERKDWDMKIPTAEYFIELKRVSKNQIIWGGNYFGNYLGSFDTCIIWDKIQRTFTNSDFELAYSSFHTKNKAFNMSRVEAYANQNKIHPTQKPVALYKWILQNYAMCKKCNNSGIIQEAIGEKWMGTQDVDCEYCDVAINGRPKILDTHLGSGSSRIAAYLMGFDFFGCEIDKDYFEAQEKRFKEQTAQGSLFDYREAI